MPTLLRTLTNGARMWDFGVLRGGDPDIDKTVGLMKLFAWNDYNSRAIMQIASAIKSKYKTDIQQIKAAFFFVITTMGYVEDGKNEFVASPRHTLTWLRQGDCDCMTTALLCLLLALGFRKLYAKVIAWKEDENQSDEFTHVYALVYVPSLDKVIPLDPVMEYEGFGHEKLPVKRIKIYKIT